MQLEQLQTQTSELNKQKSELARLGAGELIKVSQELFEEKKKNEDILSVLMQLENVVEMGKQEIETLRWGTEPVLYHHCYPQCGERKEKQMWVCLVCLVDWNV